MEDQRVVLRVNDEIRQVFASNEARLCSHYVKILGNLKSCNCKTAKRTNSIKTPSMFQRMSTCYQMWVGVFSILICLLLYTIWMARKNNHDRLYGNGACVSSYLWDDECPVAV